MKLKFFLCALAAIFLSRLLFAAEQKDFSEYDRALSLRQRMSDKVYCAEVKPQWLADGRLPVAVRRRPTLRNITRWIYRVSGFTAVRRADRTHSGSYSDHGSAETPYGKRRRADFFVKNLLETKSP